MVVDEKVELPNSPSIRLSDDVEDDRDEESTIMAPAEKKSMRDKNSRKEGLLDLNSSTQIEDYTCANINWPRIIRCWISNSFK